MLNVSVGTRVDGVKAPAQSGAAGRGGGAASSVNSWVSQCAARARAAMYLAALTRKTELVGLPFGLVRAA